MGIDVAALDYLMFHRDRVKGDTLQLGRQGLHLKENDFYYGQVTFAKYEKPDKYVEIFSEDGNTEKLFTFLGASTVESLDYSPFEGATHIHDLNDPVPEELENKFDFIFDGGTIEHVYDVKSTMTNIKRMLKVGGTFMSVNICNGHVGHGFYQFSPELYRTVFSEENGFNILSVKLAELNPIPTFVDLPTPPRGARQLVNSGHVPLYICFAAEKVDDKEGGRKNLQQSDYLAQWGELT